MIIRGDKSVLSNVTIFTTLLFLLSFIYLVLINIMMVMLEMSVKEFDEKREGILERVTFYRYAKRLLIIGGFIVISVLELLLLIIHVYWLLWLPVLIAVYIFDGVALPSILIITYIMIRREA
jgi:archaellum biogenesis protein FlaJ (TadC family)